MDRIEKVQNFLKIVVEDVYQLGVLVQTNICQAQILMKMGLMCGIPSQ